MNDICLVGSLKLIFVWLKNNSLAFLNPILIKNNVIREDHSLIRPERNRVLLTARSTSLIFLLLIQKHFTVAEYTNISQLISSNSSTNIWNLLSVNCLVPHHSYILLFLSRIISIATPKKLIGFAKIGAAKSNRFLKNCQEVW